MNQMHKTQAMTALDVQVDGSGSHSVFMLHGWPDTLRLWDGTVAALAPHYRCLRASLPGFDLAQAPCPTTLDALCELLREAITRHSPGQPVTLLLHDWGCVFGYEFAARHPTLVARIVAVDIGDHNSGAFARALTAKMRWQVFAYQCWLALAWLMGWHLSATLANRMTRSMARAMRCPTPMDQIGWQQNYPYAMQWLGSFGGFKGAARVRPPCPVLYLYGKRKPFMFHSPEWLETLDKRPGSATRGFATGHWIMVQDPEGFQACVLDWLRSADAKARAST